MKHKYIKIIILLFFALIITGCNNYALKPTQWEFQDVPDGVYLTSEEVSELIHKHLTEAGFSFTLLEPHEREEVAFTRDSDPKDIIATLRLVNEENIYKIAIIDRFYDTRLDDFNNSVGILNLRARAKWLFERRLDLSIDYLFVNMGRYLVRGEEAQFDDIINWRYEQINEIIESITIQRIREYIEEIDFSVNIFPINMEIYTTEMDKVYKEAFYRALHNEITIRSIHDDKEFLFTDTMRWERPPDFYESIIRKLRKDDYYYIDFDGDGLPELVVLDDGPTVLKYRPDEDQVYIIIGGPLPYWYLLGSGQLYYRKVSSANRVRYGYRARDENGKIIHVVFFIIYYNANDTMEYFVCIGDDLDDVEVDKETWDGLTRDFFEAIENVPPPLTFEEIFSGYDFFRIQ